MQHLLQNTVKKIIQITKIEQEYEKLKKLSNEKNNLDHDQKVFMQKILKNKRELLGIFKN